MSSSSWARLASAIIGFVGLFFVARLAWSRRDDLSETLASARPGWLVIALVAGVIGMGIIGWAWRRLVIELGSDVGLRPALRGFFVGQLGKYVPGGVWTVVGLGEGARREGVPGPVAYAATFLSLVTSYVAATLVAAIALVGAGLPSSTTGAWITLGVVALAPLGLLVLHPGLLGWATGLVRRVTGRQLAMEVLPWRVAIGLVVRQTTVWLFVGLATWLVMVALGGDIGLVRMVLATSVAWVVGFLTLPVPGGIGVREFVFVAVLGEASLAPAVALAARLLFVLVDVVGAVAATAWSTDRRHLRR